MKRVFLALAFTFGIGVSSMAAAFDAALVGQLAFGTNNEKIAAIRTLVAQGDAGAVPLLTALAEGELQTAGERILIVKDEVATDALTGVAVTPLPEDREDVIANNRVRGAIANAVAALRLLSPERELRFEAAQELLGGIKAEMLPLVKRALGKESDAEIKSMLERVAATIQVKGGDKAARIAAIRTLAESRSAGTPESTTPPFVYEARVVGYGA